MVYLVGMGTMRFWLIVFTQTTTIQAEAELKTNEKNALNTEICPGSECKFLISVLFMSYVFTALDILIKNVR